MKQAGFFAPVLIVLIIAVLALGGGFFVYTNYSNNRTKTAPIVQTQSTTAPQKTEATKAAETANWKTYTNEYYNFKLEIPTDWKMDEKLVQDEKYVDGEYQVYTLFPPNGNLIIDNRSIFSKNNHIKTQLPNTKIQLGEYTVDRYPYINDNDQRIDYVQLYNIKRQKSLTFAFNGDVEKNNALLLKILRTFAYTKQEPSLDDTITYAIPSGWKKEDTDTSLTLSFVSSDFHEEGLPTIVSGARIAVGRVKRDPKKTFVQQITPNNDVYGMTKIETKNVTLGNMQYTNVYSCGGEFGFCHNSYSIENNGYIWSISMMCNKDCNQKAGADSTIYAKDRDAFLGSVKFK